MLPSQFRELPRDERIEMIAADRALMYVKAFEDQKLAKKLQDQIENKKHG